MVDEELVETAYPAMGLLTRLHWCAPSTESQAILAMSQSSEMQPSGRESKRSLYARLICCAEYIADICIRAAVRVLVIDIQEMIAQGYVTDQMIVVGRRAQENSIKGVITCSVACQRISSATGASGSAERNSGVSVVAAGVAQQLIAAACEKVDSVVVAAAVVSGDRARG